MDGIGEAWGPNNFNPRPPASHLKTPTTIDQTGRLAGFWTCQKGETVTITSLVGVVGWQTSLETGRRVEFGAPPCRGSRDGTGTCTTQREEKMLQERHLGLSFPYHRLVIPLVGNEGPHSCGWDSHAYGMQAKTVPLGQSYRQSA